MFSDELGPLPFSLFDEYGYMRKSAKSAIAERLGVYTSESRTPEVVIVDGGTLLYHVVWPHGSTVSSLAERITNRLKDNDDNIRRHRCEQNNVHQITRA